VYGDGYPVKVVYEPKALIAAFEAGENIPVVARTPGGEVVGYAAMYRSAPNPKLYEVGQGLVLPAYRGVGIAARLGRATTDVLVSKLDLEVRFGEAVCNHTHIQKMESALGGLETAIEVDLMPHEAYVTEGSASGRVAALAMFRIFRARKKDIYLPSVYEDQIRYMYSGLGEAHEFLKANEQLSANASEVKIHIFAFAQVARIDIHQAGVDLYEHLAKQEKALLEKGITVLQIWPRLSWPWVGEVVAMLRSMGYFLGGPLPGWYADADALLMQKVVGEPNWDGIHLYSDRAKRIMELIHADWEAVCRGDV
jgi:GNAT superfamily N-acetyltransferase